MRLKQLPEKLDWTLLHMFFVVAESRALSQAAIRLNVTPSAVSHGLRRLEEQAGLKLVDRSNRHFDLTEQGRMLFAAAAGFYSELGRLEGAFSSGADSVTGAVNLMVLSGLLSSRYDAFLADFHMAFPLIKLNVEVLPSAGILKRVQQNAAAVGLCLCQGDVASLHQVLLIPQRISLYCGRHHPLFEKKNLRHEDLLSENFVSWFSEQLGDVYSPLVVFRDTGRFKGGVVATANSHDEMKRLLYAGYGIGCIPDAVAEDDVRKGNLRRLPPEKGILDAPIYLVWSRKRALKHAERVFIDGICAAFGAEIPLP